MWSRLRESATSTASPIRAHVDLALFRLALRLRPDPGVTKLGSSYGGWMVPLHAINGTWTCYTVGVGEDATFDVALARLGCRVVAIDPTPRAIVHMRPLLREYPNITLLPYALAARSGTIDFFPPVAPEHVSYSATNRQGTDDPIRVVARTLNDILEDLGHQTIQLLKLDIEGSEYEVLPTLDLQRLGLRVLCVEFHDDYGLTAMIRAARSVEERGFRVAAVDGWHVSFIAD